MLLMKGIAACIYRNILVVAMCFAYVIVRGV